MDPRQLLDDCRYWIDNRTYEPNEIAVRFHNRLVWIHSYPKWNDRHKRLATDLPLTSTDWEPFPWRSADLVHAGETRERYVAALRDADNNNIEPFFAFVRS